ncbi:MAG: T9SS type A sorting domain-containing protein [Ignavibacteria bacterium]|nr:T9SS type A sorting domain-containing protein [Ignavibacteria bacterium]
MKKCKILFFLFVLPNILYCQWIDQSYHQTPLIYIFSSKFINSSTGFLGGLQKILKTTNGGSNWNSIPVNSPGYLYTMDFKDENTGVVFTYFDFQSQYYYYRTTNSGINWIQFNSTKKFNGVKFLNQNSLLAVGDSGFVGKSTDFGNTWNIIQSPTNVTLGKVFATDSSHCFATGYEGVFLRSSDGGLNWELLSIGTNAYFNCIYFVNNNTGFVTSSPAVTIKKTTNAGISWTTLNLGIFLYDLTSVFFPSQNTGYATGYYSIGKGYQEVILKSTNVGTNWINVATTNTHSQPLTSYFLANDTGWIAGSGGLILKTTNGGLTYINGNGEVLSDYKLEQNYPNPFNPLTRINYELQISNYVTLNVYDVNGRLVKELVNEKQAAGNYSIDFDGSGLPSGTYIYRFQAGDFSETKKMVLVK